MESDSKSCDHDVSSTTKRPSSQIDLSDNTKKRKVSKVACTNCRTSKVACDESRPCKRCVKLKLDDSCIDHYPKRRGRKSNKNRSPSPSPTSDQRLLSIDPTLRKYTQVAGMLLEEREVSNARNIPSSHTELLQCMRFLSRMIGAVYPASHTPQINDGAPADRLFGYMFNVFSFNLYLLSSMFPDRVDEGAQYAALFQLFRQLHSNDFDSYTTLMIRNSTEAPEDHLGLKGKVDCAVYDEMPIGVFIVYVYPFPFQTKTWINKRTCEIIGYPRSELVQRLSSIIGMRCVFPGKYSNRIVEVFWMMVRKNMDTFTEPSSLVTAKGEHKAVVTTFKLLMHHSGVPFCVKVFIQEAPEDEQDKYVNHIVGMREKRDSAELPAPESQ